MPNISIVRELTPKQKIFADTYIDNGGNFAEAYKAAYSTDNMKLHNIYAKGHETLSVPQVQLYIDQHRAALGRKMNIDREYVTENMVWALHNARNAQNPTAVAKTAMELAKLHGLVIEKHEVDNTHKFQVMESIEVDGEKLVFNVGDGKPRDLPKVIDVTPEPHSNDIDDLI